VAQDNVKSTILLRTQVLFPETVLTATLMTSLKENMDTLFTVAGTTGACVLVYFGFRVVATLPDVLRRWRSGDREV
jgi:threonine/homoserine/homoserine lactone efflux protein